MTETEIIKVAQTVGHSIAVSVTQYLSELNKNTKPIPLSIQLWSKAEVGAYLGRKETALNRLICQPGFPERIYLPTEQGTSQPLWRAVEVIKWVEAQQQRSGRPRTLNQV